LGPGPDRRTGGQPRNRPRRRPGRRRSTGAPKHSVAGTAQAIIAFLDALGLREIDLLSFSLGGFVAQEISLIRPWSVRRLILVGTGPRGAPGMYGLPAEIEEHARHDETSADDLLHMHAHLLRPYADQPGQGEGVPGPVHAAQR
jgi:pimeloyl-ACP methyl ester carboxylesterase